MNRETIIQMAREAGLAEVTDTAESLPADYVEALAKLCALAVAKEREECAWQPIETAPKDGTNVLLINRKGNQAAGLWMNSLLGVGWYLRGGNQPDTFFNDHHGPTHWMPLPPPPSAIRARGEAA